MRIFLVVSAFLVFAGVSQGVAAYRWSEWREWSQCTASCGIGVRTRTRSTILPRNEPITPENIKKEHKTKKCRNKYCGMGPDGCSFTHDDCNWSMDPFSEIPWTTRENKKNNSHSTPNGGPARDHTGYDYEAAGKFKIVPSQCPLRTRAIFRSPIQRCVTGQYHCLKFFYHMFGKHMGDINVYLQKMNGARDTLATISGDQGYHWLPKSITFSCSGHYFLLIEGNITKDTPYSNMAIDDISLLLRCFAAPDKDPNGIMIEHPNNTVEVFYDFDRHGDHVQDLKPIHKSNEFQWMFDTVSSKQYQYLRHSSSYHLNYEVGRNYLFPDWKKKEGGVALVKFQGKPTEHLARLVTKQFSKDYRCMSFWYFAEIDDDLQFNVYKNTSKEVLLWSLYETSTQAGHGRTASGFNGLYWTHAIIPINGSEPFNIIFEAVQGTQLLHNVALAIDDLYIGKQQCDKLWPKRANPVNGLNCPFNHNQKQCSWTALQGEVYWKYMDSWHTDSKKVLPTLKGGHIKKISYRPIPMLKPPDLRGRQGQYMFLNDTRINGKSQFNKSAKIASPYILSGPSGKCFQFWYAMNSVGINTLRVYKEFLSSSGVLSNPILEKTGLQTSSDPAHKPWIRFAHHIPGNKAGGKFRIVIEGLVSREKFKADPLAIDDITITDGPCR